MLETLVSGHLPQQAWGRTDFRLALLRSFRSPQCCTLRILKVGGVSPQVPLLQVLVCNRKPLQPYKKPLQHPWLEPVEATLLYHEETPTHLASTQRPSQSTVGLEFRGPNPDPYDLIAHSEPHEFVRSREDLRRLIPSFG